MSVTLHLKLEPIAYPYPEASTAYGETWGRIMVFVVSENQKTILLDWQWNLEVLIEWFLDNENFLLTQTLPEIGPSESLAQAEHRLTNRDYYPEEDDDKWSELLYQYRSTHSLNFALPGTPTPRIMLGINRSQGEISHIDPDWAYTFNMEQFLKSLRPEFQNYLEVWQEMAETDFKKKMIAGLLERLSSR